MKRKEDSSGVKDWRHGGQNQLATAIGWDKKQVDEFQQIWMDMKLRKPDGLKALALALTLWLVDDVPIFKELFSESYSQVSGRSSTNSVQETLMFSKHNLNLILELDFIISYLGVPDVSAESLRGILLRHVPRSVTVENFEEFRDKFHNFLEKYFFVRPRSRNVVMWYQFFDTLCKWYKQTLEEERARTDMVPCTCRCF